jgi:hypothetical protein
MPLTFQDLLRQKAEGSALRDRNRSRGEWLAALHRLFDQVREWLHEADPDDVLEIVPYEVERVEERLGIYDAPALKIRLGTDAVEILPVGRYAIGPLAPQILKGLLGAEGTGGPAAGRVDITNGERKHLIMRSIEDGQDRWYAVNEQAQVTLFDRSRLEAILLDLLS